MLEKSILPAAFREWLCQNVYFGFRSLVSIDWSSRFSISVSWRVVPGLLYTADNLIFLLSSIMWMVVLSRECVGIVTSWCVSLFVIRMAAQPVARLSVIVIL